MKTDTSFRIVEFIKNNSQAGVNELANHFNISRQALHRQLTKLVLDGVIYKIGKPPRVFYLLKKEQKSEKVKLPAKIAKFIEENYLIITPSGERKEGVDGFVYWCERNSLDPLKTAGEYAQTVSKYMAFKKGGLLDGMAKFRRTFEKVYLDGIHYLDFYSLERFGKTKLGQLLLYGKQSGNRKIIKEIVSDIKPRIERVINNYKIDAIGFIPWTVKREVQFIRELEKGLNLNKARLKIEKVKTDISVPQKTLAKLIDRVENAQNTIVVTDIGKYGTALLIDDAVGSGATLNEVARQIKEKGIAKKVIGLSITGSFKGFDVVSEV